MRADERGITTWGDPFNYGNHIIKNPSEPSIDTTLSEDWWTRLSLPTSSRGAHITNLRTVASAEESFRERDRWKSKYWIHRYSMRGRRASNKVLFGNCTVSAVLRTKYLAVGSCRRCKQ